MTAFTRRSFLRTVGLGGLTGLTLPAWFPRLAFSAPPSPQRDVLIAVFLRGAADGLNIVVPFGDREGLAKVLRSRQVTGVLAMVGCAAELSTPDPTRAGGQSVPGPETQMHTVARLRTVVGRDPSSR